MRFKKIYIEITNSCNLSCPFCIKNSRKIDFITEDKFNILLDNIKNYTNYIYFHILGEPLLHPNINKLIKIAENKKFNVNITTNGYLINNIIMPVRQINISLHSFTEDNQLSLKDYLNNIFNKIAEFKDTYFSLRLWVNNKYTENMIEIINSRYNCNLDINNLHNTKITSNAYLNIDKEFIWPDLNNNYYEETGRCYGLISHIGILVDGTIVPCCLDSKGIIALGNIYNENLEDVLNSSRVQKMINGFKNNKKCEELCKHCKYL